MSNSQGRNLSCSVTSARSSRLSSTQGMDRERAVKLRYLVASLTNTNDNSSNRVVTLLTFELVNKKTQSKGISVYLSVD